LPVPHQDFFQAALQTIPDPYGQKIILNDAKVFLQMETASSNRVTAKVQQGGIISPNKGITLSTSEYRVETLSAKDRAIVEMTRSTPYIRYAISYIKDALEMEKYRELVGKSIYLIAKLERQTALDDALKIAHIADELWVCRGDLGAELGLGALAEQVFQFSNCVADIPKPVLMAGQVLEHMTEHTTPTRSEVCYLYECLIRGYQGIVLSDETAIGTNPVDACRTAALFKS
jgi:pyruvate kinase